jgi:hypothetical protein
MYDIDLLWHTHISIHPCAYLRDCTAAIGRVSHTPSPAVRSCSATHSTMWCVEVLVHAWRLEGMLEKAVIQVSCSLLRCHSVTSSLHE